MTPREHVYACLDFTGPDQLPHDYWQLPAGAEARAATVPQIDARHPSEFGWCPNVYRASPRSSGDPFAIGTYIDEWGVVWENAEWGHIGEVKKPILTDLDRWRDVVKPPWEILPADPAAARATIDAACRESDRFIACGCCPRPFERYQFLRGTEEALIDIAENDPRMQEVLAEIHRFYMAELEFWCSTAVDAIKFMDDLGSQRSLLMSPRRWRALFKPLYADYCRIAKAHGKKVFMHSDGQISDIIPDLVEIGVDALNSQLGCMDLARVAAAAKGRLTFWGEIDRQHVLPAADPELGRRAVREIAHHLYDPRGGIIVQFEIAGGANPAVISAVVDEWEKVHAAGRRLTEGPASCVQRPASSAAAGAGGGR
jgi:hypothetical protein